MNDQRYTAYMHGVSLIICGETEKYVIKVTKKRRKFGEYRKSAKQILGKPLKVLAAGAKRLYRKSAAVV